MDPSKSVRVPPAEQDILDRLQVIELTEPDQVQRSDTLITEHQSFGKRFRSARGGRERLHALIVAKHPQILDL